MTYVVELTDEERNGLVALLSYEVWIHGADWKADLIRKLKQDACVVFDDHKPVPAFDIGGESGGA